MGKPADGGEAIIYHDVTSVRYRISHWRAPFPRKIRFAQARGAVPAEFVASGVSLAAVEDE